MRLKNKRQRESRQIFHVVFVADEDSQCREYDRINELFLQWNHTKYPRLRTFQSVFCLSSTRNAVAIRSELHQSINQSINRSKESFPLSIARRKKGGVAWHFSLPFTAAWTAQRTQSRKFPQIGDILLFSHRSIDFSLLFWLHLNHLSLFYKKGLKMAQHNVSEEGPEGTVLELEQSRRDEHF